MTRSKPPLVFRLAAALLLASAVVGGWWQHQPAGPTGRAFLAAVAQACPATAIDKSRPTLADTAHALDHWAYARLGDLVFRDGRDRCWAAVRHGAGSSTEVTR